MMAQRTDPARLYSELIAAGVPQTSLKSCRSGGTLPTLVWSAGHPTAAEQAKSVTVLASHDPDIADKEDKAEKKRVKDLEAIINDKTASLPKWRDAVSEHLGIMAKRMNVTTK